MGSGTAKTALPTPAAGREGDAPHHILHAHATPATVSSPLVTLGVHRGPQAPSLQLEAPILQPEAPILQPEAPSLQLGAPILQLGAPILQPGAPSCNQRPPLYAHAAPPAPRPYLQRRVGSVWLEHGCLRLQVRMPAITGWMPRVTGWTPAAAGVGSYATTGMGAYGYRLVCLRLQAGAPAASRGRGSACPWGSSSSSGGSSSSSSSSSSSGGGGGGSGGGGGGGSSGSDGSSSSSSRAVAVKRGGTVIVGALEVGGARGLPRPLVGLS